MKKITAKRIDEIESGKGKPVTLEEVITMAKALDVHPMALLWSEDVSEKNLMKMDSFFKKLSFVE